MSKINIKLGDIERNLSDKSSVMLGDALRGATTSDQAILKKEIVRQVLYAKSIERLEWTNAVDMVSTDALDLKFEFPVERVLNIPSYPGAEMATKFKHRLEWYPKTFEFQKETAEIFISDRAKAKMLGNVQLSASLEAAVQGLKGAINKDISDSILAAIDPSMEFDAVDTWKVDTGRPATDISVAIEKLLTVPNDITEEDIRAGNGVLFYPVGLYSHLNKIPEVKEIIRPFGKLIEDTYRIKLVSTRLLANDAIFVMKGSGTARHYTYTGKDLPTSEIKREYAAGDTYIITKNFKTVVLPESKTNANNLRIVKIRNVA